MTKVSRAQFTTTTSSAKNLAQMQKSKQKLEIGQILKGNTDGYQTNTVISETRTVSIQPSSTESAETVALDNKNIETAKAGVAESETRSVQADKSEAAKVSSQESPRAKSTSISRRRHYEKKIGIYKDKKTKNLAEWKKQHKKLEVGQTLSENTSGYKNKKTEKVTNTQQEQAAQTKTTETVPKTQAAVSNDTKTQVAIKPAANPTNTQAAKTSQIVLNERGTYDVKLPNEPTRTFTQKADAQKFLDNAAKNIKADSGTNALANTSAASKVTNNLAGSKSTLTPIEPGKAPFNKNFWGSGNINLDPSKISYRSKLSTNAAGTTAANAVGTTAANAAETTAANAARTTAANAAGTQKTSLRQVFSAKNVKSALKTKGGKFGLVAAATVLIGGSIIAVTAANSSKEGYTSKYLQSPDGWMIHLKNYEKIKKGAG